MVLQIAGEHIEVPDGTVIGIVGDDRQSLMQWIHAVSSARVHGMAYNLDGLDAYGRLQLHIDLERLRRVGDVAVLASHCEELLRLHADEIWWIHEERISFRGSTPEGLAMYARHVANRFQLSAAPSELSPKFRRGDGRAQLLSVDLLDNDHRRTSVLASGSNASIRVGVRYLNAVDDPVVGIMIRTRIGMEVYGTNTELEGVRVGPCRPGDSRDLRFDFRCDLCPGRYTLTAASHDADGVWHDWMEYATAFTVTADRYTAGVANLRARVSVSSGFQE